MTRSFRSLLDKTLAPIYVALCSKFRRLIAPELSKLPPGTVYSHSGFGLGENLELSRVAASDLIHSRDVLIVGVDSGQEIVAEWRDYRPRRIVGVDIFSHPDPWSKAQADMAQFGIKVEFLCGDAMSLPLADAQFDLVYSRSVLEHIKNPPAFLAEAKRVLRTGGVHHAYFGPLWYCFGGPHIESLAYDHLILTAADYLNKARALQSGWEWWLEHDLFNRYTFRQYMRAFNEHYTVWRVAVAGSPEARAYKRTHRREWGRLISDHQEADLMIRLVSVVAVKGALK